MFEDAIFAAYNKANQTIHEATKAKLALTQKHYDGELEVHTGSSIFGVRLVSFGIGDRGSLTLKNIGRDWRNLNHQHITKRKLINLVVSRAYAVTYEFLRSTDMVCPSMIAMTWKRPNRKDAAWVVLLKNAVIVQRYGDIGDFARYVAIGEELIELVPKSMPHIPEETAGLVPGALNLLRR